MTVTAAATFRVVKSLNSSVVLAVDSSGNEFVLLGKGIGYGRRAGDVVDPDAADQAFVPVSRLGSADPVDALRLLTPERLHITEEIVKLAEARLRTRLNRYLLVALTDHLAFVLERARSGSPITPTLWWEMPDLYPGEYAVATMALDIVERHTGIRLPPEEAVSITLHLVNAEQEDPDLPNIARLSDFLTWLAALIDEVSSSSEAPARSRLMRQGRSLYQRLLTGDPLDSEVGDLLSVYRVRESEVMTVADRICAHITATAGAPPTDEELLHLALYLKPVISTR